MGRLCEQELLIPMYRPVRGSWGSILGNRAIITAWYQVVRLDIESETRLIPVKKIRRDPFVGDVEIDHERDICRFIAYSDCLEV